MANMNIDPTVLAAAQAAVDEGAVVPDGAGVIPEPEIQDEPVTPVAEPLQPTEEQLRAWAADKGFVHVSQIPQPAVQPQTQAPAPDPLEIVLAEKQRDIDSGNYVDELVYQARLIDLKNQSIQNQMAQMESRSMLPSVVQAVSAKGFKVDEQEASTALAIANTIHKLTPALSQLPVNQIANMLLAGHYAMTQEPAPVVSTPVRQPVRMPGGAEPVTPGAVHSFTDDQKRIAESLSKTYGEPLTTQKMLEYRAAGYL